MEPLAFDIPESCRLARASRSVIYEAIGCGDLRAVKRGRRTLILAEDLRKWVQALPPIERST